MTAHNSRECIPRNRARSQTAPTEDGNRGCANIFILMTIEIRLNGEARRVPSPSNVFQLLEFFELPKERVAVERNRSLVPRSKWDSVSIEVGDEIEVVHFVGGGESESLVIAGHAFGSRLLVGTGKYPSHAVMRESHERSGTEMVTVAVRRI